MKKIDTSPISGMQELLPASQQTFNCFKQGIMEVFHRHGFQSIETPMIERTEILLAKAGGDTEKQIYKVIKTSETAEDSSQALRFDHTVPLARYVAEHLNDLAFPFKVTQIGRNFRGERAQRGRFREFYQCDVDVIGRHSLPLYYDAEVIMTLVEALKVLPLPSLTVRISNRKLLSGLLEELNLQHRSVEIFSIVDHAEKVPPEKTQSALVELKIGSDHISKITEFIKINGSREMVIPKLQALGFSNATFNAGIEELNEVLKILEQQLALLSQTYSASSSKNSNHETTQSAANVAIIADMLIVRGLDYYTSTVFETVVPEYREIGSICSGGRYDNLASNYTDQTLPGIGGSIGLTRLFYILHSYNLIQDAKIAPIDFCLIPITIAEIPCAEQLAKQIRQSGKNVDVLVSDKKIGQRLAYAAKTACFAVVIGEDEVKTGDFVMKNLASGAQTPLAF